MIVISTVGWYRIHTWDLGVCVHGRDVLGPAAHFSLVIRSLAFMQPKHGLTLISTPPSSLY